MNTDLDHWFTNNSSNDIYKNNLTPDIYWQEICLIPYHSKKERLNPSYLSNLDPGKNNEQAHWGKEVQSES